MNRQVPTKFKYLILGSGKLAKNLGWYFDLLHIPYLKWSRQLSREEVHKTQISTPETTKIPRSHNLNVETLLSNPQKIPSSLQIAIEKCSHVLLAISDNALHEFVKQLPKNKIIIHFSGNLSLSPAYGVHPLMTFTENLQSLDFYKKIPFVVEENPARLGLRDLIHELDNPWTFIKSQDKPLYHAMCVVGGNFTNILWREVHKIFSENINIPAHFLKPYIEATFHNIIQNPQNSLTGPLQRKDLVTIENNIKALNPTGLSPLYREFLKLHQAHNKEF